MATTVLTTVVTPAANLDLTTLASIKDDLAIPASDTSSDATLARYVTEQSALVARTCNRVFAIEAVQDQFFLERDLTPHMLLQRLPALQLSRWPLVAVTSVTEDGVALNPGADFLADPASGRLLRLDDDGTVRPWHAVTVVVAYQAGYLLPGEPPLAGAQSLPADLETAVLRLVTARFKARGRDPFLKSQGEPGVGQEQYWIGALPGQTGPLPPDIAAVLDKYRVPALA